MRPFNVYGPRQVGDGAIRGITLQALRNLPITLYNDGTQIRSWCFVDDFVDGVLRCAENPAAIGQAFNLGNPQGTATNFELANLIIRLTNSKSEIVFKPHPGPEVDLRVPSIEKAMTLLGFKPTVSLEAGVSQAIAWYRDNYDAVSGKTESPKPQDLKPQALKPPSYGAQASSHETASHRRVRIHRPQRPAARAARVGDRGRVSPHARPRGVRQGARA